MENEDNKEADVLTYVTRVRMRIPSRFLAVYQSEDGGHVNPAAGDAIKRRLHDLAHVTFGLDSVELRLNAEPPRADEVLTTLQVLEKLLLRGLKDLEQLREDRTPRYTVRMRFADPEDKRWKAEHTLTVTLKLPQPAVLEEAASTGVHQQGHRALREALRVVYANLGRSQVGVITKPAPTLVLVAPDKAPTSIVDVDNLGVEWLADLLESYSVERYYEGSRSVEMVRTTE